LEHHFDIVFSMQPAGDECTYSWMTKWSWSTELGGEKKRQH